MGLLKTEADKLSNNELEAGIIEELIERDDLFSVLPFMRINTKAYLYTREFVGTDDNITNGTNAPAFIDVDEAVKEGAAKFVEVVAKLRILAGDVDIDNFLQETESDTNNQTAVQLAAKAKAVGRKYHDVLVNGNATSNAKEFDGVKTMVTTGQTIPAATNGAALTLSMLDQLLDAVPLGADVLMMRRGTVRAFRSLLRAAGGTSAAEYMVPAFGRPMLTHNGVPIIVNDFLPGNEAQGTSGNVCCSIYAMRMNESDGLVGLYGGPSAGIRVELVGTVQNKDAKRYRLKWYCGAALKSTKSIARLSGITNI